MAFRGAHGRHDREAIILLLILITITSVCLNEISSLELSNLILYILIR